MVHKAVLNAIFSFLGFNFSTDNIMITIIRACYCQVHHSGPKVPPLKVDVVLQALLASPFELMDTADLKHVTRRMLFSSALANAKRVGELRALSATVVRIRFFHMCLSL